MNKKVAVVGSGVAGIVSAYLLSKKFEVTLFEADSRLGGHTSTVEHDGLAIDTGFIVLNDKNYPLFNKFLAELKVGIRNSDMSFAYECRKTNFAYAGTDFNGLFAQRKNLFSLNYYKFLAEIRRFCVQGLTELDEIDSNLTLRGFLSAGEYSNKVRDDYLLPMGAAIWSAPLEQVLDFPAKSFLAFFKNHGLLSLKNRPQWQTVVAGSFSYLKAFSKIFNGKIKLNTKVLSVDNNLLLTDSEQNQEKFDYVVFAAHADQTLAMLSQASAAEKKLLSVWKYQANKTVLHTDVSFLPKNRRAWASWNYIRELDFNSKVTVTYHMNRLQGLQSNQQYCVTLNPTKEIDRSKIIREFSYDHPQFDLAAINSQKQLETLQGLGDKFFCGSYFGYGFHEDAVRSAVNVAEKMGVSF